MGKSKAQGTKWETRIVTDLHHALGHERMAWRLAEGGSTDPGDIATIINGEHWIIEAKHRERLNIHDAIKKARAKVAAADLPFYPYRTVLIWKRTDRSGGTSKPVGAVVVMDYNDWLDTIAR